jgi:hypothetical protein
MDWISLWVCRTAGKPSLIQLASPLWALVTLFWTAALPAQPPPGEIRVARLIRDLGANDFSKRQAADDELAKLGPEGRAHLEQALSDNDPEVRLRAKRLLERLKLQDLWSAGGVRLQAQAEPASKILLALAAQSGNHIHIGDPYGNFAEKKLDVDYSGVSYWEAVDDVCRQTTNRVRPHYDMHTPGIVVSAGPSGNYPRAYAGPVRAQITGARRTFIEELNYEEQKTELTNSFQFNLQFTWEDRFRIVGYATQPELVEAVTDGQVAVSAAQPSGGGWNATSRGLRQVTATLKLNPVSVTAKALDTLKIKWGLIAVGQPAVLDIGTIEPMKVYSQDDLAAKVESLEWQSAGKYILSMIVVRDMALPEPHEVLFQEYEVELIDAQGRAFRQQSQAHALTDRGVQLKTTLIGESAESVPKTIKLHYPRIRARRDLELVFRNVPLPVSKPE